MTLHRAVVRWGLLFVFWNLVGLAFVGNYYLFHVTEGIPFDAERALWVVLGWYPWILLTPLVAHLARRYRVERRNLGVRLGQHLGLATMLSALEVAVFVGTRGAVTAALGGVEGGEEAFSFLGEFHALLLRSYFFDLLVYTVVVSIVHALDWYLKTATLEARLAQAQLQTLRMQLNPHFLFNTLHAISALMDEDVRGARRMLIDLGDLLRLSLDQSGEQVVPLEQELAFLDRYLKIEQVRFQDRLTVTIDVADEVQDALVPNLILQPLVENAIKHGIAPFSRAGHVAIRALRLDDRLELVVQDNGPGLRSQGEIREGVGLRNTRARLDQLYGDDHHIELANGPEGGLRVVLDLPFTLSAEAVPA